MADDILAFPNHIDRNYFGAWLSGFTDGEGCFYLGVNHPARNDTHKSAIVSFSITLRSDDTDCLKLIQSYLQCGRVGNAHYRRKGQNPGTSFVVSSVEDLHEKVLPHFEQFPLFAKKAKDCAIWKTGVKLAHLVKRRTCIYLKRQGGKQSKWNEEEWKFFIELLSELREQRKYKS